MYIHICIHIRTTAAAAAATTKTIFIGSLISVPPPQAKLYETGAGPQTNAPVSAVPGTRTTKHTCFFWVLSGCWKNGLLWWG